MTACVTDDDPASSLTHGPIQAHPETPSGISASNLLLSRMTVAFDALARIGPEWPNFVDLGETCIVVFDANSAWLFTCDRYEAPAGYRPSGQSFRGATVLFNDTPLLAPGQSEPVPWNKLTTFAGQASGVKVTPLGANAEVVRPAFFIKTLESLGTSHPAFSPTTPTEEWLGIYVHEYFHIYQLGHPRMAAYLAIPNRSRVSADVLEAFAKATPEYEAATRREVELLRNAFSTPVTAASAKRTLSEWKALYDARIAEFAPILGARSPGGDLAVSDGYYTFLEGTARYVETRFLTEAAFHDTHLEGDDRYSGFRNFEGRSPANVPGLSGYMPKSFYPIGMYVAYLLDAVRPDWKSHVYERDDFLVGQVRAALE